MCISRAWYRMKGLQQFCFVFNIVSFVLMIFGYLFVICYRIGAYMTPGAESNAKVKKIREWLFYGAGSGLTRIIWYCCTVFNIVGYFIFFVLVVCIGEWKPASPESEMAFVTCNSLFLFAQWIYPVLVYAQFTTPGGVTGDIFWWLEKICGAVSCLILIVCIFLIPREDIVPPLISAFIGANLVIFFFYNFSDNQGWAYRYNDKIQYFELKELKYSVVHPSSKMSMFNDLHIKVSDYDPLPSPP